MGKRKLLTRIEKSRLKFTKAAEEFAEEMHTCGVTILASSWFDFASDSYSALGLDEDSARCKELAARRYDGPGF